MYTKTKTKNKKKSPRPLSADTAGNVLAWGVWSSKDSWIPVKLPHIPSAIPLSGRVCTYGQHKGCMSQKPRQILPIADLHQLHIFLELATGCFWQLGLLGRPRAAGENFLWVVGAEGGMSCSPGRLCGVYLGQNPPEQRQ